MRRRDTFRTGPTVNLIDERISTIGGGEAAASKLARELRALSGVQFAYFGSYFCSGTGAIFEGPHRAIVGAFWLQGQLTWAIARRSGANRPSAD